MKINQVRLTWTTLVATATLGLAGGLSACHGLPGKIDETATWPGSKLYAEAQAARDGRDWGKCAKYFEKLEGTNLQNQRMAQAQINAAYCYWRDGETLSASQAVTRFIRLHPDHPQIAYAWYLQGLMYFNDDLGPLGHFSRQDISERDSQALAKAFEAFSTVVNRYPRSRYAPDAAQRMRYIANALAAHEIHIARYYYRRGAWLAAVNRAQYTLRHYPNTPANAEALHIMQLSYQALGEKQFADDARRVLKESFPDSADLYLQDPTGKSGITGSITAPKS